MSAKLLLLEFNVKQLDPMLMPQDPGSMLRGAFGHALKALSEQAQSTVNANNDIALCNAYFTIFEQPKGSNSSKDQSQPHNQPESALVTSANKRAVHQHRINPYVLKLPSLKNNSINSNQNWTFSQLLIGERAIACAPIVIEAWAQALRNGIGNLHKRYRVMLQKATAADAVLYEYGQLLDFEPEQLSSSVWVKDSAVYEQLIEQFKASHPIVNNKTNHAKDIDSRLVLNFITPFRAQQKGKIAHTSTQLDIKQFLYSLYNRIQHCLQLDNSNSHDKNNQNDSDDLKLGFSDFYDFKNTVDKLTCDSQLTPYRISRHSSRQERNITLFALTGSISLQASTNVLARLLPVLQLGECLHIGKNSTLGLGQYRLALENVT